MKHFWKGLIVGGDPGASLAKTMLWLVFTAILVSWFVLPHREIGGLTFIFDSLLLYVLGGKAAWSFSRGRGGKGKTNDDQS